MNPEVVDMIGKVLAVNVVATLLLAVLSYAWSFWSLKAVALLDRWLDPSGKDRDRG